MLEALSLVLLVELLLVVLELPIEGVAQPDVVSPRASIWL